ncbi:FAR1 DNA binding domain-containing protein [Tanacetum coccineum]
MVVIDEHHDHDIGESSMSHDPHDMGESSMHRDAQVDNQIVILPEDLQHPGFWPYLNGTPDIGCPDVPEDEKPRKIHSMPISMMHLKLPADGEDGEIPDETMKCNYNAFGDVVSFDATFHTNKYGYKFDPFTGIDHHQKCVTFGAALLSDETIESFCWMLEAFLKDHKNHPPPTAPFAVKDQDGAHRTLEVQHEIRKSLYACTHIRNHSEGSVETCIIRHRDKRSNIAIDATNVLPTHLLDKRHRYGPCIEETDTLASQVHQTIEDCISFVRNDTDKLSELLSMVKVLKKKLEDETHTPNVDPNKEDLYADMLGVTVPDKVVIKTPRSIFRSKGTRRIKSAAEIGKAKTIARTNRKVPFKRRTCSKCGGKGHNKATCKGCNACGEAGHHKGLCKKFPNQDKDEVDDEDEGDNEDEVDDENGVDNEDELDEDEDDEEYISEEE